MNTALNWALAGNTLNVRTCLCSGLHETNFMVLQWFLEGQLGSDCAVMAVGKA